VHINTQTVLLATLGHPTYFLGDTPQHLHGDALMDDVVLKVVP